MTEQEWHITVISNALVQTIEQVRHKAHLLLKLADEADPPEALDTDHDAGNIANGLSRQQ